MSSQANKIAETAAQSMTYGERAAVNNTTWLVIGRYRDASAQQAMAI